MPDRFDVTRRPNSHAAFGWGTHYCLGASVARQEIRVMFEEFLRRLPDFRLDDDPERTFARNTFAQTPKAMNIECTPA
jgi:cytochrome P450 family 142 subfamily A polypeptide 1